MIVHGQYNFNNEQITKNNGGIVNEQLKNKSFGEVRTTLINGHNYTFA